MGVDRKAVTLPKFIVLNNIVSGDYVTYVKSGDLSGYVQCKEPSVFGTYAKIKVEPSKTNPNYVHLLFCSSNKYWARRPPTGFEETGWIVASSDKPEEDTTKPECTLFQPYFEGNHVHFTHVQTGGTVSNYRDDYDRLYVYDEAKSLSPASTFRLADWDALVRLPERVAFKGSNGKFLKSYQKSSSSLAYLRFSSSDGNTRECAFNVHVYPDGHVRIKSEGYGKFWRNAGNWITGDSTDADAELFWPVKVNDSTIALRSRSNGEFVQSLSVEGKEDCLNAAVSTIIEAAKLVVEELVLERSIYNVRYRMEDARIYDEKPFLAGIAAASNESNEESSLSVKVGYDDSKSYSFSNSVSVSVGVSATMNAGVPGIVNGEITVSAEVETGFEWERTVEETKTAEALYTVTVPAKSRARIQYVGTHGKCSVPFSYMQRDKSSSDGQFVTSQHTDGVFNGISYYSFHFEGLQIEPI